MKSDFQTKVGIVIVTHNSERYIQKCIEAIYLNTTVPKRVVIVDNASSNRIYLQDLVSSFEVEVIYLEDNFGFAVANNMGVKSLKDDANFILFLNPDAFLSPDFLDHACKVMEAGPNSRIGILTGKLIGYDIGNGPTGLLDSTGIFRTSYGRFYDRGQGEYDEGQYDNGLEEIPIACGALMFCRKEVLQDLFLSDKMIFDETFFMYKEDIDLSLRIRAKGYQIVYMPSLKAFHCRGWNRQRSHAFAWAKRMSLHNDWRLLNKRYYSNREQISFGAYLIAKSIYVLLLEPLLNRLNKKGK